MYNLALLMEILDFTQRWVADENWSYTADVTPFISGLRDSQKSLLVFYGLDTVANIVSHRL